MKLIAAEILRRAIGFVVAMGLMVTLGSISHSLFVQYAWSHAASMSEDGASITIPVRDRVEWAIHDLAGMVVAYGSLTGIALIIAFLLAGLLARFTGRRGLIFGIAGATAILILFTALRVFLGTVGVFGARGIGLCGQALAGLLAGLLFARMTSPQNAKPTTLPGAAR